jgi:hypothetical protein
MKKRTVLSLVALSALVYSCKKDDDKSNAEKIVGKWNKVSTYYNNHVSGHDLRDTTTYSTGEYTWEFKNDGTAVETATWGTDNSTYTVTGSLLILHYNGNSDNDTFTIKNLTGSDMSLYMKDPYANSSDFEESTDNWKK